MKKIQLIKLYLLVIVFISGFVFVSQAQADVTTYTVETSVAAASNSVVKIGPDGYPRIAYTNGTNLIYLQCLNTTCSSKNSTTIHTSVDGNWFDMVLGSDGFGRLSVSNTNASLQFIQCTNASCSTRNTSAALDSGSLAGRYNSLTLNSSGNAVIAYYKGGNNDALLYTCSNASCSSGSTVTIYSAGNDGYSNDVHMGSDGYPRVQVYTATGSQIYYIQCTNASCSTRNTNGTQSNTSDGRMELASDDTARIILYDITNSDLLYVQCTNASCSTKNITTIDDSANDVGDNSEKGFRLDSNNYGLISYYDATAGDLKYIQCTNASCSTRNTTTIDSTGDVGSKSNMTLDSSGYPFITYYDATNSSLKLAICDNASCVSEGPSSGYTYMDAGSALGGGATDCYDDSAAPCPPNTPSISGQTQTSLTISWSASTGPSASSYNIQWCQGASCTPSTSINSVTSGYQHTGRTCNTTYRYRIVAVNASGSSQPSEIQSGTTSACVSVPTVTSPTVTSISQNGATLGANVTSNGGETLTARGTCWGTTTNPTGNCVAASGTSTGTYTHSRTGLPCGTLIYYRGYADNSAGRGYSTTSSFNTSTCVNIPTVTSPTVSSIGQNGATLGANVTNNGGETLSARGTCWGTSNPPSTNCQAASGTGTGTFTHARTGMNCGTTYFYRGYATNSAGTGYSTVSSFTTSACVSIPTVTSPTVSSIGQNGATLGGNVTSNGGATLTARGTCWGTSNPPSTNCQAASGTTTGTFSHARTGMSCGTTYFYRAYATNSAGTGYSTTSSFTTSTCLLPNGSTCTTGSQCQSGNCYTDNDGDRYAPSSGTRTCRASTQLSGTDCYDSNATAYPGQTTYYAFHRGDGSFDYNCDGLTSTFYGNWQHTFSDPVGTCLSYRPSGTTGPVNFTSCGGSVGNYRRCARWATSACGTEAQAAAVSTGPAQTACPSGSVNFAVFDVTAYASSQQVCR